MSLRVIEMRLASFLPLRMAKASCFSRMAAATRGIAAMRGPALLGDLRPILRAASVSLPAQAPTNFTSRAVSVSLRLLPLLGIGSFGFSVERIEELATEFDGFHAG